VRESSGSKRFGAGTPSCCAAVSADVMESTAQTEAGPFVLGSVGVDKGFMERSYRV
jgi:hypothetical protein